MEQLFCSVVSAAPCPHHNKPDHTSPMALAATSGSDGCPQCAAALPLADGVAPGSAEKDEAEDGAVEETDGEGAASGSKGKRKKRQEGEGKLGGCCRKSCSDIWYDTRMKLWEIVESKYFNRGIMIAILINTISMGIEHHEQVRYPLPCTKRQSLQVQVSTNVVAESFTVELYFQPVAYYFMRAEGPDGLGATRRFDC